MSRQNAFSCGIAVAMTLCLGGEAWSLDEFANRLPQSLKDSGTLRVGSQLTFAPVEYRDGEAAEPTGLSADLLDELADRLDLTLEYVQVDYAALIPGLAAGRFDMASGGISDTVEREEVVDFVNYMQSGGALLVHAHDAARFESVDDFCGHSVATMLGGRVIVEALEAVSAECVSVGAASIIIEQLPSAPDSRFQLDLGRVQGYAGDYPALVYMNASEPGRYAIVGEDDMFVSYVTSWAVKKGNPLAHIVRDAAQSMVEDGTYASLMQKWGLSGAALDTITVNLPASRR